MICSAFVFAADIVAGLVARVKKDRRKEMVAFEKLLVSKWGMEGSDGVVIEI